MCSHSSDGVEETSDIHSGEERLEVFSEEEVIENKNRLSIVLAPMNVQIPEEEERSHSFEKKYRHPLCPLFFMTSQLAIMASRGFA
ncbi:hypothetical protein CDAR_548201 [Caerostris darwini]|uniref:Uncharacterized protein n=1 Tax=Caerostris darwini TaxID=1538125 RepID=A0AAV4WH79_9ARAC|nr:hypothetical protein CDAR_548201 [Caerostris darwini]